MRSTLLRRRPTWLIVLLLAVTALPLVLLIYLGAQVLSLEREMEREQAEKRLALAANSIVVALQAAISTAEQRLSAGSSNWPEGAVAVQFVRDAVVIEPRHRVAYVPVAPRLEHADEALFEPVDEAEFRERNPIRARELLRTLAAYPDPEVWLEARLRLATHDLNAGRIDAALAAFETLTGPQKDTFGSGRTPISLTARYQRCRILAERHRAAELSREATALLRDLLNARWPLTEANYWLYLRDAVRWLGLLPPAARPEERLAAAVSEVWRQRTSLIGDDSNSARRLLDVGGLSYVVLIRRFKGETRALVADASFVAAQWTATAAAVVDPAQVTFELQRTAVDVPHAAGSTVRSATDIGLPWTLVVTRTSGSDDAAAFASRRRLLLSGFLVLIVMVSGASYFIARAVSRELAVARMQSDFVAAVSHEFRTPLTALRQFTEMLRNSVSLDDGRRRLFYDAQARATDRLTGLVESLLDFGRMEAGARPYRFEPLSCTQIVSEVVEDFRREVESAGYQIEFRTDADAEIDGDREALGRALRNLLDNAVKYSPDARTVHVDVARRSDKVLISVRDQGIGVGSRERKAIFARFHRGAEAQTRGIQGTGIGLAMVDHIVKAHRGRVHLDSVVGRGSRFTMILPLRA
jgi:signal transduction histidine kinase